jgi:hypothetical protein
VPLCYGLFDEGGRSRGPVVATKLRPEVGRPSLHPGSVMAVRMVAARSVALSRRRGISRGPTPSIATRLPQKGCSATNGQTTEGFPARFWPGGGHRKFEARIPCLVSVLVWMGTARGDRSYQPPPLVMKSLR